MKEKFKKLLKEAARAAIAAIVAAITAAISGCTTINIPDDDAHCTTFTGNTTLVTE